MSKDDEKRPLHIWIPADLHQRFKVLASEERRSITAEGELALEEHIQRVENERAKAAA